MKRLIIAAAALAALSFARPAPAEVAVHVVGQRQFKAFRADLRMEAGQPFRWKRVSGPPEDDYLNPDGDSTGDLPPRVVILPAGKLQPDPSPLVVWSRQDNGVLQLYWSVWTSVSGWSVPRRLSEPSSIEDLGVALFLDPRGDVHAAWWSGADAPGINYAKFSGGTWGPVQRLSPPQRDVRNPSFEFSREMRLFVTWEDWTTKPVRIESLLREGFDP